MFKIYVIKFYDGTVKNKFKKSYGIPISKFTSGLGSALEPVWINITGVCMYASPRPFYARICVDNLKN